ncbi:hypothetical protein LCGC14_2081340 [marine sediment metagenome]|uniref:Uncharacterized protein n=1 Tax=marine sediment metagenome TaxID=412755 RepID=A0A0F9GTX5_9ZZZZ
MGIGRFLACGRDCPGYTKGVGRCVIAYKKCMADIYERLKSIGFNRNFVLDAILPEWWEDDMAMVPANRAMAEVAIARHLSLKVADLRKGSRKLRPLSVHNVRLKHRKGIEREDVLPTMVIHRRVARLASTRLVNVPEYAGPVTAKQARSEILRTCPCVDLSSLLAFCWNRGVSVIHAHHVPASRKGLEGMALFVERRPIVVVGSKRDSPPWLVFTLAHELAHILKGHVGVGGKPLADSRIELGDNDHDEKEANEYACELLTGQKQLAFQPEYGLTGAKLADAARAYGREHGISPGVVALIYGWSAARWGPAQLALQRLHEHEGARRIIAQAFQEHVDLAGAPDATARFLGHVSAVPATS